MGLALFARGKPDAEGCDFLAAHAAFLLAAAMARTIPVAL